MNPDFDSDFEAQLSRMRPAAPSDGLKERIRAQLAAKMATQACLESAPVQETQALARAVPAQAAPGAPTAPSVPLVMPKSTSGAPAPARSRWRQVRPSSQGGASGWLSLGWTRWLAPAGVCILLISMALPHGEVTQISSGLAGISGLTGMQAPDLLAAAALPEAPVFSEVPLATEVSLVYQDDHTPMKVTRTSSQASYTWQDPESKSEITTTFPREDIVISHIDTH